MKNVVFNQRKRIITNKNGLYFRIFCLTLSRNPLVSHFLLCFSIDVMYVSHSRAYAWLLMLVELLCGLLDTTPNKQDGRWVQLTCWERKWHVIWCWFLFVLFPCFHHSSFSFCQAEKASLCFKISLGLTEVRSFEQTSLCAVTLLRVSPPCLIFIQGAIKIPYVKFPLKPQSKRNQIFLTTCSSFINHVSRTPKGDSGTHTQVFYPSKYISNLKL
jgi:hypothetical protein